jgi:DNA-binding beta-propeller fold protein YncE
MKAFKTLLTAIAAMTLAVLPSCMKYGPSEEEEFVVDPSGEGLFIINEGNYMYGNASLSYYDPATKRVENEVFFRANGFKLGDVAQSMTIADGIGWVVVNNSGVIFGIDPTTFKEKRRLTGFTSPRYFHMLSPTKAYVTQIWDPRVFVVNPSTCETTGYVTTDMDYDSGSTEMMVAWDRYIITNCWSFQNRILKIDTATDAVVQSLVVGIQPESMVMDCNGKLWVLTDGGYKDSEYGYEAAKLLRIDPESFKIELSFSFPQDAVASKLTVNSDGDELYWLDTGVWKMPVDATHLPVRPFISREGSLFYGLTVNPVNGEIYVSDAIDFVQSGVVLRYSPEGELIDTFNVGINPGNFCWR